MSDRTDMHRAYHNARRLIMNELEQALSAVDVAQLARLKTMLLEADQVFFVGVGRVMLALQATAKRMAHLGIRAHVVGEITEPAITPKDLLVVGSGSGSTLVPLGVAQRAKALGARVAHIGSNPDSPMAEHSDLFVRIPVRTKQDLQDEIESQQPMTSLFEQSLWLLGDILAKMLVDERQTDLKALWRHHANLE